MKKLGFMCIGLLFSASSLAQNSVKNTNLDMANAGVAIRGYKFETVANDPINVKIHTLKNGMKLYLTVNKNEPRVFTNIAVRAGSKQDPAETTGLAHYLEHMVFKGTNKIAALNWEKEEVLLKEIADLYEAHRKETDPAARKAIYAKIDSVSNVAAKLVAANEYDKLVSSLGAKATNAYTNNESTVYVNDIPSNELEKWMRLESERFQMVVLRLFHTELEAVYEEFNIGQDNDGRNVFFAMLEMLYPTHPYGTQTTIGKGEHLKSPSHYNILNYFKKYYVPNNMAIVMSGDFDPEQVVALAEKYFGSYEAKPVPAWTYTEQAPLSTVQKREVTGQQSPYVQLGWRMNGAAKTNDYDYAAMVSAMLYNRQAGLFDLDLVQQQKVLEASAFVFNLSDYATFMMSGRPREGQTLEEVENLLLAQVDRLKKGDFPDWLMAAVLKDFKYSQTKSFENNTARVSSLTDAFVKGLDWQNIVERQNRMAKITKKDIIDFANKYLTSNSYAVVYKRTGENKSVMKVEKPKITPVALNRKDKSAFAEAFLKTESPRLSPVFVDFKSAIKTVNLKNGIKLDYIKNDLNETFSLNYIVEMGKNNDKLLPLAFNYLPLLGTEKYTAAQLQQEFYKLGLTFDVFSSDDRCYVTLTGLEESFTEGVKLFEHILANVKPDEKALKNMVADILSRRENDKKDKRIILRSAMASYAKYGKENPFTDILSKTDLEALTPAALIAKIKGITAFEHRIFYYGTQTPETVANTLNKEHKTPKKLKPLYAAKIYDELATDKNKVIFVHFPMVQAEILMISKGTPQYSVDEHIMSQYYNNYFGAGLSSIVFQEIREARALAYSANAFFSTPSKQDRAHYYQAYVGTQADKLKDAVTAMQEIINEMPISEIQIEQAKQSVLKTIESERITKANIYWTYRSNLDRGIENDMRQNVYQVVQNATAEDLKNFQKQSVKGRKFTYLILGDRARVNFEYLNALGEVKELSLEEIYGY